MYVVATLVSGIIRFIKNAIQRKRFFLLALIMCLFINNALCSSHDSISNKPAHFYDSISNKDEGSISADLRAKIKSIQYHPVIVENDSVPGGIPFDSIRYYVNRAHALFKQVTEDQRFTDFINAEGVKDLPIGIRKTIGSTDFVIVIDSIILTPTHAYLNAFMSLESPTGGDKLAFMCRKIKISKDGGIFGDAQLELLEDFPIKIGNNSKIIFKGGGKTYAAWNCGGFKTLSVGADIEFSRDFLVPENPDGTIKDGQVKGSFDIIVTDWRDLVASITLTPFQVAGLKGVGFYVKDAVLDFSDINNSPGVVFPEGYQSTLMTPENPNLWEGFFMKELTVKLPPEFKKKNNKQRTEFSVFNMLIDNMGFSGTILAKNLITREEGDMGGWAFSLSEIEIELQANSFKHASISGGINVPIFEKKTDLLYKAIINPGGTYAFTVEAGSNLTIPLFSAGKVDISPSSFIEIVIADGQFKPRANLTGKMSISAGVSENSGDGNKLNLAEISFENLEIATVQPYIKVKSFSLGSPALQQKMSSYPLSINNIGLKSIGDDIGIQFTVKLNLVGEGDGGFAGDATLAVMGGMDTGSDWLSWKFKYVDVSHIGINIDSKAFKLKGSIDIFKQNPTYGSGFKGAVAAEFMPGIKLTAMVLFGNVGGMRYWYADAMLVVPSPGVVVYPGFAIYGFGGGAYCHMKQDGFANGATDPLGVSSSGIVYKPDPGIALGIKASVSLGTSPSNAAFNGEVTFEIAFHEGGGIDKISFTGAGYFVTPPVDLGTSDLQAQCKMLSGPSKDATPEVDASKQKGQISARVNISYDFTNSTLHGNLEVYVSVAGGALKGTGSGNKAGEAVLHFAPDQWYIRIGTPDQRIGLKIMDFIRADAYLMVGNDIPGSPPPPAIVSEILGGTDLDYMRDENAIGKGSGFAFGASFGVDTGDLTFLIFYARFEAGAGFDIMLKNYGPEVHCKGNTEPLGVNGWYANGQAYAYFRGKVGIKVDLGIIKGQFEILSIGAAAVLQAKLPNPLWMRGIVGGEFSILGGLVKGNCKFEATIGEECEMEGASALAGVKIIAEVTPTTGSVDVDVFNAPQVVFNVPVDKDFDITGPDEETKKYRVRLNHFKLLQGSTELPGALEWNDDKTVLAYKGRNVFPSKKELTASVKISFEEFDGGQWRPLIENGKEVTEQVETTFTSGIIDHIPQEQVAYSYPVINQFNFYKDETRQGYIKLKQGMPELFQVSSEWIQVGRITSKSGEVYQFSCPYSDANIQIDYAMPAGLKNNQIYKFEIVNLPAHAQGPVDSNVEKVEAQAANGDATVTTKEAEGTINILQEKSIYGSYFRTSQYNTFLAKIDAFHFTLGWVWPVETGVHVIGLGINGQELFDKFEISTGGNIKPIIQFEADLNNNWFKNEISPLIYASYPVDNSTISWRRPVEDLGVPPIRGISIDQTPNDKILSSAEIESNTMYNPPFTGSIVYKLSYYMFHDYEELKNKAGYEILRNPNPWFRNIFNSVYPTIRSGDYYLKMRYVLPGSSIVTSEKQIKIRNP